MCYVRVPSGLRKISTEAIPPADRQSVDPAACLEVHHSAEEKEPGSSASIVSDYVLYDRAIQVRSPAEAKGFFL
jgi:hypothetical protein